VTYQRDLSLVLNSDHSERLPSCSATQNTTPPMISVFSSSAGMYGSCHRSAGNDSVVGACGVVDDCQHHSEIRFDASSNEASLCFQARSAPRDSTSLSADSP